MGAHHPPSRGDPLIQQALHDRMLICLLGQLYAIALPIATRPLRLMGERYAREMSKSSFILIRQIATFCNQAWQPLKLDSPHRSLYVCHPVVVAEAGVMFEMNNFGRKTG